MQSIHKTRRSLQVEFTDETLTSHGGMVLLEKLGRRYRLWSDIEKLLPARDAGRCYDTVSVVSAMIYGLSQGGRGLSCTQGLRDDAGLLRVMGLPSVPSDATVHRALLDLAGLGYRKRSDAYEKLEVPPRDLFGVRRKHRRYRRKEVEDWTQAGDDALKSMDRVMARQAVRMFFASPKQEMRFGGFVPVFGDGTQLEVEGRHFEGAVDDYNGNRSLQWATVWLGGYLYRQRLREGSAAEAGGLVSLITDLWKSRVGRQSLAREKLLFLLDAAYGEDTVFRVIEDAKRWYVIGANKMRNALTKTASAIGDEYWEQLGGDDVRRWNEVGMIALTHEAEGWGKKRTVIACRYKKDGELFFRYTFLWTNLEPDDVLHLTAGKGKRTAKGEKEEKISYCRAIWRLYSHKQARENQFKTGLTDMGLHHPPSGMLACNQMFYGIAGLAMNLNQGVSLILVSAEDRNIRLWRLRVMYYQVAARVRIHGGRVIVALSGTLGAWRQTRWKQAWKRLATA